MMVHVFQSNERDETSDKSTEDDVIASLHTNGSLFLKQCNLVISEYTLPLCGVRGYLNVLGESRSIN